MDHNSFDCQEKKSKMIPVDGYEADLENTENILLW